MFVKTFLLTDEQKKKVSEMDGKIILWILEGRSVGYMSDKLNLPHGKFKLPLMKCFIFLRNK